MRTRWGRLYLIDFGVARRFNPDKKRDTSPLGAPGYAAAEQYGRAQSTAKTDIYGLGVPLQSLLTGKEPLDDEPVTPPTGKPHPACQQLQHVLDQMQTTDAFWRPHTMWDIKKHLLSIQPGNSRLVSIRQKAFPLLIGLFIGSLPYSFLPLVWLFSSRDPNAGTLWFLVPVLLLFFFWPFVFICQCVTAFSFFFAAHLRERLIACGILLSGKRRQGETFGGGPYVRIAHFTLNNCPLDNAFFMVSVLEYKLYFVLRSLAIQRDEDRH